MGGFDFPDLSIPVIEDIPIIGSGGLGGAPGVGGGGGIPGAGGGPLGTPGPMELLGGGEGDGVPSEIEAQLARQQAIANRQEIALRQQAEARREATFAAAQRDAGLAEVLRGELIGATGDTRGELARIRGRFTREAEARRRQLLNQANLAGADLASVRALRGPIAENLETLTPLALQNVLLGGDDPQLSRAFGLQRQQIGRTTGFEGIRIGDVFSAQRPAIERSLGAQARGVGAVFGAQQQRLNEILGQQRAGISAAFADPTRGAAERDILEAQFANARRQILERSPARGGALGGALANLATNRALGVGALESRLAEQERAAQLGAVQDALTAQLGLAGAERGAQLGTLEAALGARLGTTEAERIARLGSIGRSTEASLAAARSEAAARQTLLQQALATGERLPLAQRELAQRVGLSTATTDLSLAELLGRGGEQFLLSTPGLALSGQELLGTALSSAAFPSQILATSGTFGGAGGGGFGGFNLGPSGPSPGAQALSGALGGATIGAGFGPFGAAIGGLAGGALGFASAS